MITCELWGITWDNIKRGDAIFLGENKKNVVGMVGDGAGENVEWMVQDFLYKLGYEFLEMDLSEEKVFSTINDIANECVYNEVPVKTTVAGFVVIKEKDIALLFSVGDSYVLCDEKGRFIIPDNLLPLCEGWIAWKEGREIMEHPEFPLEWVELPGGIKRRFLYREPRVLAVHHCNKILIGSDGAFKNVKWVRSPDKRKIFLPWSSQLSFGEIYQRLRAVSGGSEDDKSIVVWEGGIG